jgi:hypothetical protein
MNEELPDRVRPLSTNAGDSDDDPGALVGDTGVLDGGDKKAYAKVVAERSVLNVPAHLMNKGKL